MSGSGSSADTRQTTPTVAPASNVEQGRGAAPQAGAASPGGGVRAQLRGMNYKDGAALVAPETQAPETQAPETQAPETQAPETQAPETQAPDDTTRTGSEPAGAAARADSKHGQSKSLVGMARDIQDLVTLESRREGLTEHPDEIPSQDVVYEQLAHRFAYDDAPDATALAAFGYACTGTISDSDTGLTAHLFEPIAAHAVETAARQGHALHAVVAFRGTEVSSAADAADDLNTEGIGMFQFSANEPAIEALMARAAPVDLVGHSLGGALAQIAASRFAGLTNRVVTFQSPGIRLDDVQNLQRSNAGKRPDQRVGATHYRVVGDVVPLGGAQHIDGVVTDVAYTGVATPASHTTFPLANIENLRGGAYAGQLRDGDDEVITNTAVSSVTSHQHRGRGTQSTEGARVAAGEALDHAAMTPNYMRGPLGSDARTGEDVNNFQGDDYTRAWEAARAQAIAGVPLATILATLTAAPDVDPTMRRRLVANMSHMYRDLAPGK